MYRDSDCGFVGFHDIQGHRGFYTLNFLTLLQITTNTRKITIANIRMINKARYRSISSYYKLLVATINSITAMINMTAINYSNNQVGIYYYKLLQTYH